MPFKFMYNLFFLKGQPREAEVLFFFSRMLCDYSTFKLRVYHRPRLGENDHLFL